MDDKFLNLRNNLNGNKLISAIIISHVITTPLKNYYHYQYYDCYNVIEITIIIIFIFTSQILVAEGIACKIKNIVKFQTS